MVPTLTLAFVYYTNYQVRNPYLRSDAVLESFLGTVFALFHIIPRVVLYFVCVLISHHTCTTGRGADWSGVRRSDDHHDGDAHTSGGAKMWTTALECAECTMAMGQIDQVARITRLRGECEFVERMLVNLAGAISRQVRATKAQGEGMVGLLAALDKWGHGEGSRVSALCLGTGARYGPDGVGIGGSYAEDMNSNTNSNGGGSGSGNGSGRGSGSGSGRGHSSQPSLDTPGCAGFLNAPKKGADTSR